MSKCWAPSTLTRALGCSLGAACLLARAAVVCREGPRGHEQLGAGPPHTYTSENQGCGTWGWWGLWLEGSTLKTLKPSSSEIQ